jgi:hypothetical protein
MGHQNFLAKGRTRYCALIRGVHMEKITVSGVPNRLNYSEVSIVGCINDLQMWPRAE